MKKNKIKRIAKKKASQSPCNYRVVAIGLDYKGRFIGAKHNIPRHNLSDRRCTYHAEELLMHKLPKGLRTIVIARLGKGGDFRPIDPCEHCLKLARNKMIEIISIEEFT